MQHFPESFVGDKHEGRGTPGPQILFQNLNTGTQIAGADVTTQSGVDVDIDTSLVVGKHGLQLIVENFSGFGISTVGYHKIVAAAVSNVLLDMVAQSGKNHLFSTHFGNAP